MCLAENSFPIRLLANEIIKQVFSLLFSVKFTKQLPLTPPYLKSTGPNCQIKLSQTQNSEIKWSLKAGKCKVEEDHYAGSIYYSCYLKNP